MQCKFKYLTREILEIAAQEIVDDKTHFTCTAVSAARSELAGENFTTINPERNEWKDFLLEMKLPTDGSMCEDFANCWEQEAKEVRTMFLLFAAEAFCDS